MDSKDLHPLEEFTVDVAVCLGKLIAEISMFRNGTFPHFRQFKVSCGANSDKLLYLVIGMVIGSKSYNIP